MKRSWFAIGLTSVFVLALLCSEATAGPGARARGPRGITGVVSAKGENSLDVRVLRRGAAQTTKVTVEAATRYSRLEVGKAEDLTEGYLVAVFGERQENKVTARGVVRFDKVEGALTREGIRIASGVAGVLGPAFRGGAGDQRPQGQRQQQAAGRVVGKIVGVKPLTVETVAGQKVEVTLAEGARVLCAVAAEFKDIQPESRVSVIPKTPAAEGAVTAEAVILLPQGLGVGAGARPNP